jgi:uncharacterized tellurite resistance protein B-like protein
MAPLSTAPLDIVTKSQLNMLIQLAHADKHFAPEEKEMIYRVCREHQFSEEKVERMMQNPESVDSLGALSANRKFQYLMDCIELVLVDGKIMESELIFCRSIAIKMGFKKGVIDFLIANLKTISPQELQKLTFTDFIA